MTAARLEELARVAETMNIDGHEPAIHADLLDLARCARAWAQVERTMERAACAVELFGFRGRIAPWAWYTGSVVGKDRFAGPTAIEAVEAAEVKP